MNTYNWIIMGNDVAKEEEGLAYVIKKIHAKCVGVSDDGYSAEYITFFEFETPHPSTYIPYEEVTNEMRVTWIQESESPILTQATQAVDFMINEKRGENYIRYYPINP